MEEYIDKNIGTANKISDTPITNHPISSNSSNEPIKSTSNKHFSFSWKKQFYIFVFVILIVSLVVSFIFEIINIHKNLNIEAKSAFTELSSGLSAIKNNDWNKSKQHFVSAKEQFQLIEDKYFTFYKEFVFPSPLSSAREIVDLGKNISSSGEEFFTMSEKIQNISLKDIIGKEKDSPKQNIKEIMLSLETIGKSILKAKRNIDKINPKDLPENLRSIFTELKTTSRFFQKYGNKLTTSPNKIEKILGLNKKQNYLLIFQNSGEIRPTGGFIGSLALLETEQGKVNIVQRDIYSIDRNLNKKITPPKPLQTITDNFYLRDSNFWPDFPTSAKQMADMYFQSEQESIDGVIAINDTSIKKFLETTGPIYLKDYDIELTAENYYYPLVKLIENKDSKNNNPKQPLFDLQDIMISRLSEKNSFTDILEILKTSVQEKNLQIWFLDPALQKEIEFFEIAGEMNKKTISSTTNFLSFIKTSIGANKSDKLIKEKLWHKTIFTGSTIENILTISRHHTWGNEVRKDILKKINLTNTERSFLFPIFGNSPNKTYFRIYVPQGSILLDQKQIKNDIEIFEENEKTVFAFNTSLMPGAKEQFSIHYKLPDNFSKEDYSFYFWKQSGTSDIDLTNIIKEGDEEKIFSNILNTDWFLETNEI